MLRLCVLSEVSREILMCHQNVVQNISPFAWAGRSFYFLYFNVSQMTVNDICGLFMPWTFKLKNERHTLLFVLLLRNYLGSVQFYFSVLMFLPFAWQVLHVLLSLLENFAPRYDWHIWHFAFFSSSVNCSVKKKKLRYLCSLYVEIMCP